MMANRSDRRLLTLRCVRALEAVGMSTRTRRADFHQGQGSFATPISQAGYMTATRFPLSVPHPCTRAGSIYDTTFLYWLGDFAGQMLHWRTAAEDESSRRATKLRIGRSQVPKNAWNSPSGSYLAFSSCGRFRFAGSAACRSTTCSRCCTSQRPEQGFTSNSLGRCIELVQDQHAQERQLGRVIDRTR